MLQKEKTVYNCNDYNSTNYNVEKKRMHRAEIFEEFNVLVDTYSRQKMCEWSYKIVDHFNGNRELVQIAQNYLDRFVQKFHFDCSSFKLAAITCLYLAIKIHNHKPISCESLTYLSNGEFTAQDITETEDLILKTLDWNLHPPTASWFCTSFHCSLPPSFILGKPSVCQLILERSCFFSELSVMEHSFSSFYPSEVAFAAILNTLEGLRASLMSNDTKREFVRNIEEHTGLSCSSERIKMMKDRLWALYLHSRQFDVNDDCSAKKSMRLISSSTGYPSTGQQIHISQKKIYSTEDTVVVGPPISAICCNSSRLCVKVANE